MDNRKRRIAVFTGNRAEYGLQYPILRAFDEHPDIEYHLIVSGAHLDKNFGQTLEEIKNDGFEVYAEVALDMEEDTLCATAQAIGSGIVNISRVLDKVRPDILVVYADRFEGFAAVVAGTQINIPTAHIEGGDLTEGGALDDSVRHAMSKLAHIHFNHKSAIVKSYFGNGGRSVESSYRGFTCYGPHKGRKFCQPKRSCSTLRLEPFATHCAFYATFSHH